MLSLSCSNATFRWQGQEYETIAERNPKHEIASFLVLPAASGDKGRICSLLTIVFKEARHWERFDFTSAGCEGRLQPPNL